VQAASDPQTNGAKKYQECQEIFNILSHLSSCKLRGLPACYSFDGHTWMYASFKANNNLIQARQGRINLIARENFARYG
jgi:hypothetical protein